MKTKKITLAKALPFILIAMGIIGYAAAFILTQDKIAVLKDPNHVLNCNINPIISCGDVMNAKQSNAFGFPNTLVGFLVYPMLIAVGAAMLAGGVFKRWFWLALNAGALGGVFFVHWLFYQTTYHIGAVCPYCVLVWASTITTFWYVTLYNLGQGNITLPSRYGKPVAKFVQAHHLDLLILWFLIIFGLILKHFWYYFGRNF